MLDIFYVSFYTLAFVFCIKRLLIYLLTNDVQVDLSWYEGKEKVDLTDYVNSGTWDIIACPGRNDKPLDNDTDAGEFLVSQITFILRIRRKVSNTTAHINRVVRPNHTSQYTFWTEKLHR